VKHEGRWGAEDRRCEQKRSSLLEKVDCWGNGHAGSFTQFTSSFWAWKAKVAAGWRKGKLRSRNKAVICYIEIQKLDDCIVVTPRMWATSVKTKNQNGNSKVSFSQDIFITNCRKALISE
jgi:hypothetical protein